MDSEYLRSAGFTAAQADFILQKLTAAHGRGRVDGRQEGREEAVEYAKKIANDKMILEVGKDGYEHERLLGRNEGLTEFLAALTTEGK